MFLELFPQFHEKRKCQRKKSCTQLLFEIGGGEFRLCPGFFGTCFSEIIQNDTNLDFLFAFFTMYPSGNQICSRIAFKIQKK